MIRPTKKAPPANKRHTKPCKYFAQGNCVLPAEACNFSHIIVAPLPPKGFAACRFYATGSCRNGPCCPYKHDSEAGSPYQPQVQIAGQESPFMSSPVDTGYFDGPSMYGTYPPYVTGYHHQEWLYTTGASPLPPPRRPHYSSNYISSPTQSFAVPTKAHIGGPGYPRLGSTIPSAYEIPPRPRHSYHVGRTVRSCSNGSTCTMTAGGSMSDDTSTTASTADSEVVTEDPKYSEHLHDCQSQVVVSEQFKREHIPPFAVRGREGFGIHPPSEKLSLDATPGGSRATSRNSTKPRSKYKTKPCKFWALNRICSQGDECTFRHDEPLLPPSRLSLADHKQGAGAKPTEEPKSKSPKENFFPISWRVIGGGVVVGTAKDSAHPRNSEDIPSIPDSPALCADLPPPEVKPTTVPLLQTSPPRKRSNSIPTTPSSSHVLVGSLFSAAESPGVL